MKDELTAIGRELVQCTTCCDGILLQPARGVEPRCLFLDHAVMVSGGNAVPGAAVVGPNPGESDSEEREYYLRKGISFETLSKYFEEHALRCEPYYRKLRHVLKLLRIEGPILWTELAKCETSP